MIPKAFLLGAGLGTRLRPLTELLPKPLVPLFHRPLVEWAMLACRDAGVREFAINTHHLPEAWRVADRGLPVRDWSRDGLAGANGVETWSGTWHGLPVRLFHEPELLETGGGLRNLSGWIGGDPLLVHNGDIFSSIPLAPLFEEHRRGGHVATLVLRSDGPARHVALDPSDGHRVRDIRNQLGRADGNRQFTGIYCISPEILELIPPGEKVSVIPAFLELARRGRLGAVTVDEGEWIDLGDHASYLAAHRRLGLADPVHPDAVIAPDAVVRDSVIGPGARVGAGAGVIGSVVWPGAEVAAGTQLHGLVKT